MVTCTLPALAGTGCDCEFFTAAFEIEMVPLPRPAALKLRVTSAPDPLMPGDPGGLVNVRIASPLSLRISLPTVTGPSIGPGSASFSRTRAGSNLIVSGAIENTSAALSSRTVKLKLEFGAACTGLGARLNRGCPAGPTAAAAGGAVCAGAGCAAAPGGFVPGAAGGGALSTIPA